MIIQRLLGNRNAMDVAIILKILRWTCLYNNLPDKLFFYISVWQLILLFI